MKNRGHQRATIRATSTSDLYGQIRALAAGVGPGAISAVLNRLVAPRAKRSFCILSPSGELAVLSIIGPGVLADAVLVTLQKWDALRSLYQDHFTCYVMTAGRKAGKVLTVEDEPADAPLRKKLASALVAAADQFENGMGGILAG